MKRLFFSALIFCSISATAQANDAVILSVQADSRQVTVRYFTGDCEGTLSATAEIVKLQGTLNNSYDAVLVRVVPMDKNCNSDSRVSKLVTVTATIKDLAQTAMQSLTEEQQALPVRIQLPMVEARF